MSRMNLSGFRLLRWEYGLVADFRASLTIISPYYFALIFVKATDVIYECFPASEVYQIDLSFLGKIVSFVKTEPGVGIRKVVFTDGTSLDISK